VRAVERCWRGSCRPRAAAGATLVFVSAAAGAGGGAGGGGAGAAAGAATPVGGDWDPCDESLVGRCVERRYPSRSGCGYCSGAPVWLVPSPPLHPSSTAQAKTNCHRAKSPLVCFCCCCAWLLLLHAIPCALRPTGVHVCVYSIHPTGLAVPIRTWSSLTHPSPRRRWLNP